MPVPGGISICSGGGLRIAYDAEAAFSYLKATCNGLTPDPVLRAMAKGMTEVSDYMAELAKMCDAKIRLVTYVGNYPFPGYESLGFCMYGEIPGFDPRTHYSHAKGLRGGARNFKIIEDNIRKRGIRVSFNTPVKELIRTPDNRIVGAIALHGNRLINIKARRGIILTCGGFEADEETKRQFVSGPPMMSSSFRGNTGDGIRMAQKVGASLWHMWNVHGTYGFHHPDPAFPFGIRIALLNGWVPGRTVSDETKMAWIVVDQYGRRYMNEHPPYLQDTGYRPMQYYDPVTQSYPRVPSNMLFDEEARKLYPVGMPLYNEPNVSFEWSENNLAEVELGILQKADSLEEIARDIRVKSETLKETVDRWNHNCKSGSDSDFGRPKETMVPIQTPPYYYGKVWPILSNTQGGPVHNEHWQILDAFGEPIPGLYEAGELGGIYGFLYTGGGNLAECYIGGWNAARHAAENEPF
jgi:succinate dehydrogenase/fumarate reductase flavoprotein subunit